MYGVIYAYINLQKIPPRSTHVGKIQPMYELSGSSGWLIITFQLLVVDSEVLCLSQLACGDGFATWDFAKNDRKNEGGMIQGQ